MDKKSGRKVFERNKKILLFFAKILGVLPKFILIFLWDCTANHSQILFISLRYMILKNLIKNCGDNIKIGTNVQIIGWEKLSIGNNVSIHSNCYIDSSGEIEIGDNVSIAHNSSILSANHDWKEENLPIKYNPVIYGKVSINEDVWIGCGCRILAGVDINSRSIVAAGAIVNKSIESNSLYGGVPAKMIKKI